MKVREEMRELVNLLFEDGMKIYTHDSSKPLNWFYFTDGINIGYAQEYYGIPVFSTVHKPNKNTGTGFSLREDSLSITDYRKAFTFPRWVRVNDLAFSTKWRSWEEFNANAYLDYVEVKKEDIED